MWVMTEIRQELKAILEIQKETATKVDELYERIFVSNGKRSLVSTVDSLEERLDKLESIVERRKQNKIELHHGLIVVVVGALIGSTLSTGWQIYNDYQHQQQEVQEK